MSDQTFSHRRLEVHRRAVLVFSGVQEMTSSSWWRERPLVIQLIRSTSSIALNIAEGADEVSPAEKIKFFHYARRSAAEADSTLELLAQFPRYPAAAVSPLRDELTQIAAMLGALIARCERRLPARRSKTLST